MMRRKLRALAAALQDAERLRRFAGWNVVFWLCNQPVIVGLFLFARPLYDRIAVFYLVNISITALWLSCLSWWQSARVEVHQIEGDENT